MWRWNGCTQPPPPLRISQRLKLFFFWDAGRVLPAGFGRLVATVCGSNSTPLMSHSTSADTLPRLTSKTSRLSSMDCQLLGSGGSARRSCPGFGMTLRSGAVSPITNLSTGTM